MANKINLIDVDAVIRKLERELEIIPTISLVKDPFGTVFDTPLDRRIRRLVSALIRDVINYLKRQPTVDAVEVVHGEWVHHYYDSGEPIDDKWYCSECHMCNDHRRTWYCPNCGAKMDGDGNESA